MAFSYNTSGSISEITDMTGSDNSSFYWGQEQWLCGVQNAQGIHHYVYDHAGERVMKSSITQTTVQLNDQTINTVSTLEPYTLYVNPYYVITAFSNADRKSKHYYMGTQRVATDIGVEYWASPTPQESTGGRDNTTKVGTTSSGASSSVQSLGYRYDLQRVLEQLSEGLEVADVTMTSTPIESFYPELVQESAAAESTESEPPVYSGSRILYWYHPDYVSNVDLVTDRTGEAYELFLYNAWGESLHHWTSSSSNMWSSPYRFNSKELDPETGMHYYGARYIHPKLSVWMSVDPLAHQTLETYQFSGNNPIVKIDIDGTWPRPLMSFSKDVGLYGGYYLNKSTVHLLSLVSGVDYQMIERVIIQKRAPGQYWPWYQSDMGGGAMTIGNSSYSAVISFTQNYFEDVRSKYNNHGYGKEIEKWLSLLSHEVGHLPQIDRAGGLFSYVGEFAKQYFLEAGHDGAPNEIEADKGEEVFKDFNRYVNSHFGKDSLINLMNTTENTHGYFGTDEYKIRMINIYWNSYQDSKNEK